MHIYVVSPSRIRLTIGPCLDHGCLHDYWAMEFYERDTGYLVFGYFLSIQIFLELVPPPGLGFENTLYVWCDRCSRLLNVIGRKVSGAQFKSTEPRLTSLGTTCESPGP